MNMVGRLEMGKENRRGATGPDRRPGPRGQETGIAQMTELRLEGGGGVWRG